MTTLEQVKAELAELTRRVDALEEKKNNEFGDSDSVKRVLSDISALNLRSARLKRVPKNYYDHSLEDRMFVNYIVR